MDVSGNIYASDWSRNSVQKWAPGATTGTIVAGGNGSGSAANQLSTPIGVFVDATGNIFVADADNHRIQKISQSSTTELNELKTDNLITIYPNPTSSILNIEVKEQTQITIVNVLGDVVLKQTIAGLNKLDVSALNSGVYFIQDSKSGKAIKFIKE